MYTGVATVEYLHIRGGKSQRGLYITFVRCGWGASDSVKIKISEKVPNRCKYPVPCALVLVKSGGRVEDVMTLERQHTGERACPLSVRRSGSRKVEASYCIIFRLNRNSMSKLFSCITLPRCAEL